MNNLKLERTVLVELPLDSYLRFFGHEKIHELNFLPLIQNDSLSISKYSIDFKKYPEYTDLLFKFFTQNIGEKVEINYLYGSFQNIFGKMSFIVGGTILDSLINPINIIESNMPFKDLNYRNIYSAKIIS